MGKAIYKNSDKMKLNNVRLSFPHLFQMSKYDRYETKLLIPKTDRENYNLVKNAIMKVCPQKLAEDRYCLKDGDSSKWDEDHRTWVLKSTSYTPPAVIGRDRSALRESDGVIYSGCYVNVLVDLKYVHNDWGQRVCSTLYAVQFFRDGVRLDTSDEPIDVFRDFDDLDDDIPGFPDRKEVPGRRASAPSRASSDSPESIWDDILE